MAPPIPLASVAGTLALSFTAGRAAPTPTSAPETPASVPAPPRLPPVPGETEATTPAPSETTPSKTTPSKTTPSETTPSKTTPSETATPETATPEPPLTVEPVSRPRVSTEAAIEVDDEAPGPAPPPAERLLRPNTKTLMFNLFVGGSKALRGGYAYFGGSDFKTELAIGGFNERFRVGGFAVMQLSMGFPFSTFTLAPRLSLNRQIVPDHAIYFTTNVTLGYRATSYGGYGVILGTILGGMHSAVVGVSWGASAIVGERLLLSFRPLDLELVAPAPALVQLNWSAMGGIGIVWGDRND